MKRLPRLYDLTRKFPACGEASNVHPQQSSLSLSEQVQDLIGRGHTPKHLGNRCQRGLMGLHINSGARIFSHEDAKVTVSQFSGRLRHADVRRHAGHHDGVVV